VPPAPDPVPEPDPVPVVIDEVFPAVPPEFAAVSLMVKTSLSADAAKAEDALVYAKAYRDFAKELLADETVNSNSRFVDIHVRCLKSIVRDYPHLATAYPGLGKAIDNTIAESQKSATNPDGLTPETWDAGHRLRASRAFEAVSGQAAEAYKDIKKRKAEDSITVTVA
jgi:hypothetical protein